MNKCAMCEVEIPEGRELCAACNKGYEYFKQVFGEKQILAMAGKLGRELGEMKKELEKRFNEQMSPVMTAVILAMQCNGGAIFSPGDINCCVCSIRPAYTGKGGQFCEDCYKAWLYIKENLGCNNRGGAKGHSEGMTRLQTYLQNEVGYNIKATTIAAVYVLMKKEFKH